MPSRRQGFTLIELITAIAIILVLMGMLVVGMQYLGGSSRERATRVTLANAQGMLAELEATGGLSRLPQFDLNNDGRADPVVEAPGPVIEGSGDAERWGKETVRTSVIIGTLRTVPNNKKAMDQLPASQMTAVKAQTPSGWHYPANAVVESGGTLYRNGGGPTNTPPPGGNWQANAQAAPVLLDAWNNPILFVSPPNLLTTDAAPAPTSWDKRYGLQGLKVEAEPTKTYRLMTPGGIEEAVTPTDSTIYPKAPSGYAAANQAEVQAQIGKLRYFRPFFVSAGPDGNFQTHDDNLYSFDN